MTIPYGYCKCGCGERTRISDQTRPERGWVRGEPRDYLRGHHHRKGSMAERFWTYVDVWGDDACWEWLGGRWGQMHYGRFKYRGATYSAHRVAWQLTHGPIPDGLFVLHRCDNPPCVNPSHLFLGTQKDNLVDRDRKGRSVYHRGAANSAAKLSESAVAEIRAQYKAGRLQRDIAKDFGTTQTNVSWIVRGLTWPTSTQA